MISKLTARERLVAAKSALAAIEKEIKATTEARRRVLLADAADHVAAALDQELAGLRLAAQRCADKIAWLPALVVVEQSEEAWPSTSAGIKAAIDKLSSRLRALQSKPAVDRSAAADAEKDHLTRHIPALQQRLEQMLRMEATP